MGRWLAPRLPAPQHWVVHDRDDDLLERAVAAPPDRAAVTVEARRSDVARLTAADLGDADLVVASALLDILAVEEQDRMLRACLARGVPMLFALTVVGRVALTPAEPLDRRVEAAFNAHQRRLLGPDAAAAAVVQLRGAGAHVLVRPSPWRLGAADAGLAAEWLEGWVAAACEQHPLLVEEAAAYRERRLAQAAAGGLAVRVDHVDLLVLP